MVEMDKSKLTDLEEKFCMVYACGPSPFNGNAKKTYALVFKGETGMLTGVPADAGDNVVSSEIDTALCAHQLMARDEIRNRIDEIQSQSIVNASTLRPRLTETLLKIADECSTMRCRDRFGIELSPAALRSVAVNAIGKLTDMYGIKEDIAHKVTLENAGGDGITFNLVMPEPSKENQVSELL